MYSCKAVPVARFSVYYGYVTGHKGVFCKWTFCH